MSGTGGFLSADPNCTSVAFANGTFFNNSAPAGPVVFLGGWLAAKGPGAASAAPSCVGCSVVNNSATLYGASSFAATDIASANVTLSRARLSSGSAFVAAFNLLDGVIRRSFATRAGFAPLFLWLSPQYPCKRLAGCTKPISLLLLAS